MLAKTDAEWAPWTAVEAADRYWARIKVFEAIAAALEAALKGRGLEVPPATPAPPPDTAVAAPSRKTKSAARRS